MEIEFQMTVISRNVNFYPLDWSRSGLTCDACASAWACERNLNATIVR